MRQKQEDLKTKLPKYWDLLIIFLSVSIPLLSISINYYLLLSKTVNSSSTTSGAVAFAGIALTLFIPVLAIFSISISFLISAFISYSTLFRKINPAIKLFIILVVAILLNYLFSRYTFQ